MTPQTTIFALAMCLVATVPTCAESPRTIPVGEKPESVCRGFEGKLYVSLINGEEPGDGTIVVLNGDTPSLFAKGFNNPKGIVFVGEVLVMSDETTLWKIDKDGNATKLVDAQSFPQPIEFLNDVAVGKDDASVFVTEMSSPKPMFDPSGDRQLWALDSPEAKALPNKGCVYRVTLDGHVTLAVPAGNPTVRFPNGIAVGGVAGKERIFIGEFFQGEIVRYHNGQFKTIASGMRGLDGLTVTKRAFYASSWTAGKVWRVDRETREVKVIHEGMKSAADFFYDEQHKQLVVPDMISGTLTFLTIE